MPACFSTGEASCNEARTAKRREQGWTGDRIKEELEKGSKNKADAGEAKMCGWSALASTPVVCACAGPRVASAGMRRGSGRQEAGGVLGFQARGDKRGGSAEGG